MLRTVVFKEALSTQSLPRVPLYSWSSLIPSYNRAWQFTAVLPWVGENFVVTLSDHTLFILDPENGLIVGVLTLGHQISDISITRSFVYILCNDLKKPVCRISVKQSFLRALKRVLPPSPGQSPMVTSKASHVEKALTVPTISSQIEVGKNDKKVEALREKEISNIFDEKTGEELSEDNLISSQPPTADEEIPAATEGNKQEPSLTSNDHTPCTATHPPTTLFCEYVEDDETESTDLPSADKDEISTEAIITFDKEHSLPKTETELPQVESETPPTEIVASHESLSLSAAIDTPTFNDVPNVSIPEENSQTEQLNEDESSDLNNDPQKEKVSDSGTNIQSISHSSSSGPDSGASVQSEQKEPSLQEALQTVKAEMKELFKPIKFDKLSNIFKPNNTRSLSPSRVRMFPGRNKKSDETEVNVETEPQDQEQNVGKDEETVSATSELSTQNDDIISEQEQSKKPDLKEILKLSRIGNLLSKDSGPLSGGVASQAVTTPIVITPAPLDSKELERRLRMSQITAEETDDIVVVKKEKKKKKKRKHKKLSSATSKSSLSPHTLTPHTYSLLTHSLLTHTHSSHTLTPHTHSLYMSIFCQTKQIF